jgi:hypothetical protein
MADSGHHFASHVCLATREHWGVPHELADARLDCAAGSIILQASQRENEQDITVNSALFLQIQFMCCIEALM